MWACYRTAYLCLVRGLGRYSRYLAPVILEDLYVRTHQTGKDIDAVAEVCTMINVLIRGDRLVFYVDPVRHLDSPKALTMHLRDFDHPGVVLYLLHRARVEYEYGADVVADIQRMVCTGSIADPPQKILRDTAIVRATRDCEYVRAGALVAGYAIDHCLATSAKIEVLADAGFVDCLVAHRRGSSKDALKCPTRC